MNINKIFDVSQEIVLITGSNGQLGAEYTKLFLENGARVIGLDIRSTIINDEFTANYPNQYLFFQSDITIKSSLENALKSIFLELGTSPTVLINNAAIDSPPSAPKDENGPFEKYPEKSWDKVMNVNLKGTYLACQVFGEAMTNNKNGSIINISSIYGMVSPDQSIYEYRRANQEEFYKPIAYSTSKAGILNMTRYLAVYWAKSNVRVNTLTLAGVYNNQEDSFLSSYCGRIPIGRMAYPHEYNGSVLFLASNASRYMTGSNIVVDGGWTAI